VDGKVADRLEAKSLTDFYVLVAVSSYLFGFYAGMRAIFGPKGTLPRETRVLEVGGNRP
jgi:hypothetical protein